MLGVNHEGPVTRRRGVRHRACGAPSAWRGTFGRRLAVLAAVGLVASPVVPHAQAQTTTLWSATLTVQTVVASLGCTDVEGLTCSSPSILTDDTFTYDGTNYAFDLILLRPDGSLEIEVDTTLTPATQTLTLYVDGTAFAFEDAETKTATGRVWTNAGLSWSAGNTVALRLTPPPPPPITPTPPDTDPSDSCEYSGQLHEDGPWAYYTASATQRGESAINIRFDSHTVVPVCGHNGATTTSGGTAYYCGAFGLDPALYEWVEIRSCDFATTPTPEEPTPPAPEEPTPPAPEDEDEDEDEEPVPVPALPFLAPLDALVRALLEAVLP